MPAKASYLVRGPDGRMATIIAHSVRGALKLYLAKHRRHLQAGDDVSVKLRGVDTVGWADFRVS